MVVIVRTLYAETFASLFKIIGWGLVLPQHDPRRLQPLHHLMEALHQHED